MSFLAVQTEDVHIFGLVSSEPAVGGQSIIRDGRDPGGRAEGRLIGQGFRPRRPGGSGAIRVTSGEANYQSGPSMMVPSL